jgi:predicted transcriptional regulator of viral defense system
MKKGNYISTILRSQQTVFSVNDIMLLWGEPNSDAVRVRINYYTKKGDLYRIRRGFYAKDKNYDKLELATKIFTPSYVSFETVLNRSGVSFQYYEKIFIASYTSREIIADGQTYSYHKIKDTVLTSHPGIVKKGNYFMSSPERAFLDTVYLNTDYHFDNLSILNWNKVFDIIDIYGTNKRMKKAVMEYYKDAKN